MQFTVDKNDADPGELNNFLVRNSGYECIDGDCNNLVLNIVDKITNNAVQLISEAPKGTIAEIQVCVCVPSSHLFCLVCLFCFCCFHGVHSGVSKLHFLLLGGFRALFLHVHVIQVQLSLCLPMLFTCMVVACVAEWTGNELHCLRWYVDNAMLALCVRVYGLRHSLALL